MYDLAEWPKSLDIIIGLNRVVQMDSELSILQCLYRTSPSLHTSDSCRFFLSANAIMDGVIMSSSSSLWCPIVLLMDQFTYDGASF